ncbi:MAG: hypothetical protein B7Y83_11510 [Flavobacteriales bacterium 32-34-25]|nr:MAG: hypothetical protein B7Y83_11510 [Flavobacteriales bacterium 32-34-25]
MENKNLPAIVVRGIVPIPNNDFRTEIGRSISFKALDESENSFGNYVLILIQKNKATIILFHKYIKITQSVVVVFLLINYKVFFFWVNCSK